MLGWPRADNDVTSAGADATDASGTFGGFAATVSRLDRAVRVRVTVAGSARAIRYHLRRCRGGPGAPAEMDRVGVSPGEIRSCIGYHGADSVG